MNLFETNPGGGENFFLPIPGRKKKRSKEVDAEENAKMESWINGLTDCRFLGGIVVKSTKSIERREGFGEE